MFNDLLKLISILPPGSLDALGKLIKALLSSKDPVAALSRATIAVVAKAGARKTIAAAVNARAKL